MKVGDVVAMLSMDFSQFDRDEPRAKSRVEGLGTTLSGIVKNAFSFGLGMSFFTALKQGFKATVGSAVSFNDTLEQATIGFTTMLGSATRADAFLRGLADFAAKTPFEFPGLLDASKRMLALGFAASDVIPTMTAIGDTAAALGSGQQGIDSLITGLGNIKTQGKVTSIAMMQLARAGVPSWEILAEAAGKSTGEIRKMVEQGLVSADVGIKALTEGMTKRFSGMMSKMEDSWRGVTSTIKDVLQMTLGSMTKNLFARATEWLQRVRDVASGFYDAFQQGGFQYAIEQTFGARAAASVGTLVSALKSLWGMVTGVGRTIVAYWSTIGPLTVFVAKAFLSFRLASFAVNAAATAVKTFTAANLAMQGSMVKGSGLLYLISRLVSEYKYQVYQASVAWMTGGPVAVTWLARIQAAIHTVTIAFGKLFWPILIIGTALMGGVSLWNKYNNAVQAAAQKAQTDRLAQQQKDYADAINQAADGTDAQAVALGELGKAASSNLQSFDEIHQLADDTADLANTSLLEGLLGDVPNIPAFEMPEMDWSEMFDMDAAIADAKGLLGGFWGWVGGKAKESLGNIGTWASNVWDGAKARWGGFREWAGGLLENLQAAGGQAVATIKDDALMLWGAVQTKWSDFGVWVAAWAGSLWDGAKTKWGNFAIWSANLWDGAKARWGGFKEWAVATFEDIRVGATSRWQALKENTPRTWEDIKTAIVTRMTSAKETVLEAAQILRDRVPRLWDEMRASVAALKDKLVEAMTRPFRAAKDAVLGVVQSAKDWGGNLIGNFVDGIKAKVSAAKDAVSSVASTIKGWLGFSSPTKEGPGRHADQWAPNLMKMFAAGITQNIGQIERASQRAASAITLGVPRSMSIPTPVSGSQPQGSLVDGIEEAVYRAMQTATRVSETRSTWERDSAAANREVVLRIDGTSFARLILPAIVREGERQGLRLVASPMGVR